MKTLLYIIILLPFVISYSYSNGSNIIHVENASRKYSIGRQIEYLEDTHNSLTIKTIKNPSLTWTTSHDHYLNLGISSSVYWLRFTVNNRTTRDLFLELSSPMIDIIEFYWPENNAKYSKYITGDTLPFNSRMFRDRNFIFKIDCVNGPRTCYIKIKSSGSVFFTPTIWPELSLSQRGLSESINWLFYGMFLVIIILAISIFSTTWDRTYLYLIGYVLSLFFFFFSYDGYSFMFLWPNSPQLANKVIPFTMACMMILTPLFIQSLLNTKHGYPVFHKLLDSITVTGIVFVILTIFLGNTVIVPLFLLVAYSALLILSFALAQAIKKNKMSLFLLISILPYNSCFHSLIFLPSTDTLPS